MITEYVRSALGTRLPQARDYAQYLSEEDLSRISAVQLARLQAVWNDASTNVPYYRDLVTTGVVPSRITSIQDFLARMPVLTKQIIKKFPESFQRQRKSDHWLMTAGSTGEPLHFGVWNSEGDVAAIDMNAMRLYRGMDLERDKLFLIWGHSHLLGTGFHGWINGQKRKLKDILLGYRRVDAYHMEYNTARHYFDIMLTQRPQIVCGYSSAVDLFVRHNFDRSQMVKDLDIKFVICTAEMLPKPDTAEIIKEFFNAPLMMEYGGVDFGAIAHKWEDEPYLINWWSSLTEAVPYRGGKHFSLLVTTLYPRYLPLIRYDTGDEISGITYKGVDGQILKFKNLAGRYNDIILLDDGASIHSIGLFHCIHQEASVANIQLVLDPDNMRILLVGKPDENVTKRIRKRLSDLHPSLANCSIEYRDDLLTTKAGKRRWIIDRRNTTLSA